MKRPKRSTTHSNFGGFTLIEVMITIAVIAILAAVALPNYVEYVTRSRLVEAKTNLSDMRTRMEQFFLDNRNIPLRLFTHITRQGRSAPIIMVDPEVPGVKKLPGIFSILNPVLPKDFYISLR